MRRFVWSRGWLFSLIVGLVGCAGEMPLEEPVDEAALQATLAKKDMHHAAGPLAFGEVTIDHQWKRVTFARPLQDPVVVAKPFSFNGHHPGVLRLRNVDSKGFELRIQEWSYLDDWHYPERVGYLAAERGSHGLEQGGLALVAGSFETDLTEFARVDLAQALPREPVVLTAIATFAGGETVTGRLQGIDAAGFDYKLQEEEAHEQRHVKERVDYIALSPGAAEIDGFRFLVGTAAEVTHAFKGIGFATDGGAPFVTPPVFVAEMQTTNGDNTASLRWRKKSATGVQLRVYEEQSLDAEMEHYPETVGFFAIAKTGTVTECKTGLPTYVDLEVGQSASYATADGRAHEVKLLSQSLDAVKVAVDGKTSTFDLEEKRCGSPGHLLPREIGGVLVLPEVTSDIQTACQEETKDRRYKALKVSWETGDVNADRDEEKPGFARLLLFDPALRLPDGEFPVDGEKTCSQVLMTTPRPFLVPSSYGFHHGVDLYGPVGTPLVAAQGGTLTRVHRDCEAGDKKCDGGCGNGVDIENGDFKFHYCHLKNVAANLAVGQKIEAGAAIGDIGLTGLTGTPHLHLNIWRKTGARPMVSPFPYLHAWCEKTTCTKPPGPPPPPPPPPQCSSGLPTYVDLAVGQQTTFTAGGAEHVIELLGQSLDGVKVAVDGETAFLDTDDSKCGSQGRQLPRDVGGVALLPEIVSDIQQATACDELAKHRRWKVSRVNWEKGDLEGDKDLDDPGYARLLLKDPAIELPAGVFPIEGKDCAALLKSAGLNLRPVSYGFHSGVDLWVPVGTKLVAPATGTITVLKDGCNVANADCGLCGNTLKIDDGTFIHLYCHLDEFAPGLAQGQKIEAGAYVGRTGTTGKKGNGSTSPHLHHAMTLKKGVAPNNEPARVNTYPYLDAWCHHKTCAQ